MNWAVFAVLGWFALGLDVGLAPALSPGTGEVHPSFFFPLVVFVAMRAPARTALWAGLIGGLLVDLTNPLPGAGGGPPVVIPGPHALGTLLAAQLVIALRSMVMHRNPLTMAVLTFIASMVAGIAVVALLTARAFFGSSIVYAPTHELLTLAGTSLYTAIVALLLAVPLGWLAPVFGFGGHAHAAAGRYSWSHAGRP